MGLKIPSGVLVKYKEVIDSTISTDMFGVVCQLVFIEKVEVISNTFDNIPKMNSIHAHLSGGPQQYKRGTVTTKEVEKLEEITVKVYWEERSFQKPSKQMVIPDGAIQIIGFQSDLHRIKKAKAFIPNRGNTAFGDQRFKLYGDPIPMGIGKDRYFAAFMERV